jgi:putative tricarboxylic transport membrane protein
LEFFDYLRFGFGISLTLSNLLYCFIGVVLGTAIGVLPGLGPVGTIAILLPVTFKMDLVSAIIMLAGIYYGAQYGGTITSVLVNVPGEGASVVTCFDGYPMARKGRAGAALGIAAFGSFIGGTIGIIGLNILGILLSRVALAVGPVEYSWLLILGLSLVIYLTSKSVTKGLMMAVMGLLLGTIGMDPVTGIDRFIFGTQTLVEGLNISHLAMGIFGIGELLYIAEREQYQSVLKPPSRLRELLPNKEDWKASAKPIARGTFLGFFLGCIPGGGAVVSSFLSYGVEKRVSKHGPSHRCLHDSRGNPWPPLYSGTPRLILGGCDKHVYREHHAPHFEYPPNTGICADSQDPPADTLALDYPLLLHRFLQR